MRAAVKAAIRRGAVATFSLVKITLPVGERYFWDGMGILDYDGHQWAGVHTLGRVEEIGATTEIRVDEISFVLSGVDPELLEGLDASVKGLPAHVYEAVLDGHFRVVDIVEEKECELDYQVLGIGEDGKASIVIHAHGGLIFLQNRSAAKWGPEEQRVLYPDDTGFDEIHLQEDKTDEWRPAS